MDTVALFVIALALKVQITIVVTSAIFTGTIVDMGSTESQLAAGVFPGDSQRDEDSPQLRGFSTVTATPNPMRSKMRSTMAE